MGLQVEHSAAPVGQIHLPHNWAFADATARMGATVIAADIGKIALQLDDGSYWRAVSAGTPGAWIAARSKYTPMIAPADVTLWVRSDGSDGNDGSANTASSAFATVQHAMNVAATGLLSQVSVAIKVGLAGSYVGGYLYGTPGGATTNYLFVEGAVGGVTLTEAPVSPNLFFESATLLAGGSARIAPKNLRLEAATGACLVAVEGGIVNMQSGIVFGAAGDSHFVSANGGGIYKYGDYQIDGGATSHLWTFDQGWSEGGSGTVTITGTPHFSVAFMVPGVGGGIWEPSIVFVGAATGSRFQINHSSIITGTNDWNYYPGDAPGTIHEGRYGNFFGLGDPATVANLPVAADSIINVRAIVLDASLPMAGNFGAAVVGGGANKVPVICMGTALGWRIG